MKILIFCSGFCCDSKLDLGPARKSVALLCCDCAHLAHSNTDGRPETLLSEAAADCCKRCARALDFATDAHPPNLPIVRPHLLLWPGRLSDGPRHPEMRLQVQPPHLQGRHHPRCVQGNCFSRHGHFPCMCIKGHLLFVSRISTPQ